MRFDWPQTEPEIDADPADMRVELDLATARAIVECSPSGRRQAWLQAAHGLLRGRSPRVLGIGRLGLGRERSRGLAIALVDGLREALLRAGGPEDLRVEVGKVQETHVSPGYATRTLLPHHDGGHCSYLTPSRLDLPGWEPARRRFAEQGLYAHSSPSHKLYQGIFIVDPGEAESITTYYPWLQILADGYRAARGREPTATPELATWLGDNLLRTLELQGQHGGRYPTLAASLGSSSLVFHGLSPHCAEDDVTRDDCERFPQLRELVRCCPCGACRAAAERLFCHSLLESLGLSWPAFRERYEFRVASERFDLVMGHNLVLLHGGLRGGASRRLEPISLVVDEPAGDGYEEWLAASWRAGTSVLFTPTPKVPAPPGAHRRWAAPWGGRDLTQAQ
jgi:hypothetical protein